MRARISLPPVGAREAAVAVIETCTSCHGVFVYLVCTCGHRSLRRHSQSMVISVLYCSLRARGRASLRGESLSSVTNTLSLIATYVYLRYKVQCEIDQGNDLRVSFSDDASYTNGHCASALSAAMCMSGVWPLLYQDHGVAHQKDARLPGRERYKFYGFLGGRTSPPRRPKRLRLLQEPVRTDKFFGGESEEVRRESSPHRHET